VAVQCPESRPGRLFPGIRKVHIRHKTFLSIARNQDWGSGSGKAPYSFELLDPDLQTEFGCARKFLVKKWKTFSEKIFFTFFIFFLFLREEQYPVQCQQIKIVLRTGMR
jgi:hypothetical protein